MEKSGDRAGGGASLLVVADYDAVNHQLTNARLSDGTPISIGEIDRIAAVGSAVS